ncbi:MAG: 4-hydroxy-3-methylbut-2-enyl diphosphate reductase [Ileibacterium sp.]|nr:4-hydroxy-3-methylbut-2-enyl diphosphate reductase [Ileibacterium sp.]
MEIIEIKPQGYCGGVRQAIAKVLKLKEQHPNEKITVLGTLVHNDYVRQALDQKNIQTLEAKGKTRMELLDEIDEGIVVFTAHGVSDPLRQKAQSKGLQILDASCPFVLQTQKLVKEQVQQEATVFYIGKKGHPEAEAVTTSHDKVYLISCEDDIPKGVKGPVFVTNQTTMSILDIQDLFEKIKAKYPDALMNDEICNATRVRQQAILDLKENRPDVLIVVGDPSSNNTLQLEAIGKKAGIEKVIRIEKAADLDLSCLDSNAKVAVTSGASTPAWLRQQVLDLLADPTASTDVMLDEIL